MSRGKHWTQDEYDELVALHRAGLNSRQIAERLLRSCGSVEEKLTLFRQGRLRVAAVRHRDSPEAKQPYDPLKDNPRIRALLGGGT